MTPLAVQTYLRSGRTLDDLAAEYAIRVKVSDELGVAMLNYNQIASPMHQPIVQECRALILALGTWSVVSRSFFKFFNLGEPLAQEIDWSTASIQEKIDGSLISFYHWRGEWRIATKGTPDASGPVHNSGGTFRALVERAIEEMGVGVGVGVGVGQTLESFTSQLDPNVYYAFELTAPENRIIIPYANRELTLLAAWDAASLVELDVERIARPQTRLAKRYPAAGLDELVASVQEIGLGELEGYVVKDASGRRVKIKSPAYLMVDRVMARLATPRRRLEFLLSPNYDDVLPTLPPTVQSEVLEIQARLQSLMFEITASFRELKPLAAEGRKAFALAASKSPHAPMLFRLLDAGAQGEDAPETILHTQIEWLARALQLESEGEETAAGE